MFILPDHRTVADSELVVEVGVLEREAAGSATVLGLDVAEAPGGWVGAALGETDDNGGDDPQDSGDPAHHPPEFRSAVTGSVAVSVVTLVG